MYSYFFVFISLKSMVKDEVDIHYNILNKKNKSVSIDFPLTLYQLTSTVDIMLCYYD